MKKIAILSMVLTLVLALAACGPKLPPQSAPDGAQSEGKAAPEPAVDDDDKIDLEDAAKEMVEDAIEHDAFSLAAAEAFWKAAGVEVSAAAPDWEWIVNEERMGTYGDTLDSPYGHASILFEKSDGGELSEEEYKAWAKKLFDATAAASDDGHNINGWEFAGEGEDALAEADFDSVFEGFMQGWGFMRNGRNMVVYISEEYDTEKDSAIGRMLYYYGAVADIAYGLEQSMDDAWADVEDAFEEYEDEIKDALEQYS